MGVPRLGTMGGHTRRFLSVAVVAGLLTALAAVAPTQAAEAGAGEVERVAGPDRVATAVAVSRRFWSASDHAVLATAGNFPDALAGGVLAARLDAPVLLTPGDALADTVAAEIGRLGARTVWLLGGPGALSTAIESELARAGHAVRRLHGSNRFATAAAVAAEVGAPAGEAVVALGGHASPDRAWPDALAAGALGAAVDQPPILLTHSDALPADTEAQLAALDVDRVLLSGGPGAIAPAVEQRLTDLGYQVARVSGADRHATSIAFATEALRRQAVARSAARPVVQPPVPVDAPVPLVLVTGARFPDALAAGALAARLRGVMLLVPLGDLDAAAHLRAFLQTHGRRFSPVVAVGGAASVSDRVREQARADLATSPVEIAADDGDASLHVAPAALPEGFAASDLAVRRVDTAELDVAVEGGQVLAAYDLEPAGLVFRAPVALRFGDGEISEGEAALAVLVSRSADTAEMELASLAAEPLHPGQARGLGVLVPHFSTTLLLSAPGLEVRWQAPADRFVGEHFTIDLDVRLQRHEYTVQTPGLSSRFAVNPEGSWSRANADWVGVGPITPRTGSRLTAGQMVTRHRLSPTFRCAAAGDWTLSIHVDVSIPAIRYDKVDGVEQIPHHGAVSHGQVQLLTVGTCHPVPPEQAFTLTVTHSGDGSGTTTSSPAGIDCPGVCAATFRAGTSVGLTAVPAPDSEFARWRGACVQAAFDDHGGRTVVNTDQTCDAEFRRIGAISPTVEVAVLVFGGQHWPKEQFHAAAPDACEADHWHSGGPVHSLEGGMTEDPDPTACGYGIVGEVEEKTMEVPRADWHAYQDASGRGG